MIKPADLHKVWVAPDNTRLTNKQYSFRLPVHVAAKIAALCEMFPQKTRTQIVGDLLAAALDDFEQSFTFVEGPEVWEDPDTHEPIYADIGPRVRYQKIADHFYRELERELGNEDPPYLFDMPRPAKADE